MLDTTCLLCGTQPETAPHLWACSAQSHEWGPARRRLAAWLDQKVGPRAAPVRHQLWEPTVLEQWAAALRTPSMQLAHLECTGPHSLGTEFLRHVVEDSIRIWYAHAKARATLLKARLSPGSTMAWALQELRLHQQAEREGVQRELLEYARSPEANSPGLPDSPSPCRGLHTYARRAHNTHSPARLPLPVGRHPGLLPFGNSAFGTPHHTTPHHTTPHHTTPHRAEYSPALLTGWVPGAKPPTTGPGHYQ